MTGRESLPPPVNNEVVSIEDQIKCTELFNPSNDNRLFNYELDDKALKAKFLKGSKRPPLSLEENSTSSNLKFNVGSWYNAVLPALKYWTDVNGDQTCQVGDYNIKICVSTILPLASFPFFTPLFFPQYYLDISA